MLWFVIWFCRESSFILVSCWKLLLIITIATQFGKPVTDAEEVQIHGTAVWGNTKQTTK